MELSDSEYHIVKMALRGHITEYERRIKEHNERGYTMAAMMYQREIFVLQNVLVREFNDTIPLV